MDSRFNLPPDTVLDGTYRIQRTIGAGGFGITYAAEDLNLDTLVAIKEYYPIEFGDRDNTMSVRPKSDRHKNTFDWGRSSFLTEARTVARFRHPSIVRVTRVFEANSTAYMVMDFEKGRSFEDWLAGLGRPPAQAELDAIAAALLDALELMHGADFLHRDLAPDNIIVREDGTPVLLDFGSARRAVGEMSRTLTGIVKAGYSPQEQYATDARLQGPWSDVYALGATLYRAVTGRPPEESTLRGIDDRMTPATRTAKGSFRPGFLAAIDECLKVRGADRPQSVARLRPMLLGAAAQAMPKPLAGSGQDPAAPKRTAPGAITLRQWSIVAVSAAGLLLVGALTLLLWPRPEPGAAEPIGTATIEADGTIVVDVRRPGLAILRIPRSDPHYAAIAKHIGPLRPGETQLVRPWPELSPAERKAAEERTRRQIEDNRKAEEERRAAANKKAAEERAREIARRAAENRTAEEKARQVAQAARDNEEGERHYYGRGVPKDYAKARALYEKAVPFGNLNAMNSLGWMFQEGQGGPQDLGKAREWYEKAIASGSTNALVNLGTLYLNGRGVPKDVDRARELYEKAVAADNSDGMTKLGRLYRNATGVAQDYGKARELFEKAAARRDTEAMNQLGGMYREGEGVTKDPVKAVDWFEKSAAQGNAVGMSNLAYQYEVGEGVPKDLFKAREWHGKAAAGRSVYAMERLAVLLDEGKGGLVDYPGAAEWLLQAARAGRASAITFLRGDMNKWNRQTRIEIKRQLAAQGYFSGPINDTWDSEARAAVNRFLTAGK